MITLLFLSVIIVSIIILDYKSSGEDSFDNQSIFLKYAISVFLAGQIIYYIMK